MSVSDIPPSIVLARFLARFDALCAATGWSASRLSRVLFTDSDRVEQIRKTPSDVGVKRLAQAELDLSRLAAEAGVTLPDAVESADSDRAPRRPRANGGARP